MTYENFIHFHIYTNFVLKLQSFVVINQLSHIKYVYLIKLWALKINKVLILVTLFFDIEQSIISTLNFLSKRFIFTKVLYSMFSY